MDNIAKKLPDFAHFDVVGVNAKLDTLLACQRKRLASIEAITMPTWENTLQPLQWMEEELDRFWSPVRHLNAVDSSEAIRAAYNEGLAKLSIWYTDQGQNSTLHRHVLDIRNGEQFAELSPAQQRVIDHALRDFELSGVSLGGKQRARYKAIAVRLAGLGSTFEANLLDCSNAWKKPIPQRSALTGLPVSALGMAEQYARDNGQREGWMLGLAFPLYHAVLTYADDRTLREQVYTAYNTRASDQGTHDKKWQNDPIIDEILALRHEKAKILGFDHYPQLSVQTKMVDDTDAAISFLQGLLDKAKPQAQCEFDELCTFARDRDGLQVLRAWDVAYYSEKQKQELYAISDQDLRPYFPAGSVVDGMFAVVGRLYDIRINEVTGVSTWHPDVRYYEIVDDQDRTRGGFYLDIYARARKREGAWMDECVTRCKRGAQLQMPIAYLTCNVSPPTGDLPSLMTHEEVITLFHEFGHGLHHLLTLVDYPAVAGINGVEWDAVELPSQFMENWCWQRESLDLISSHYRNGEKIPDALLERVQQSRNFQSAMRMMHQIELSLFDMQVHLHAAKSEPLDVQAVLDDVRAQVAVVRPPRFNRFQNGFSHIFSGGYAAGYFSYQWAEVLSADAFSRFEEEGIFNKKTGSDFMHTILQQGGTKSARALFVEFRGREPKIDALLRHTELAA